MNHDKTINLVFCSSLESQTEFTLEKAKLSNIAAAHKNALRLRGDVGCPVPNVAKGTNANANVANVAAVHSGLHKNAFRLRGDVCCPWATSYGGSGCYVGDACLCGHPSAP